jgi:hypothetical protein
MRREMAVHQLAWVKFANCVELRPSMKQAKVVGGSERVRMEMGEKERDTG